LGKNRTGGVSSRFAADVLGPPARRRIPPLNNGKNNSIRYQNPKITNDRSGSKSWEEAQKKRVCVVIKKVVCLPWNHKSCETGKHYKQCKGSQSEEQD